MSAFDIPTITNISMATDIDRRVSRVISLVDTIDRTLFASKNVIVFVEISLECTCKKVPLPSFFNAYL